VFGLTSPLSIGPRPIDWRMRRRSMTGQQRNMEVLMKKWNEQPVRGRSRALIPTRPIASGLALVCPVCAHDCVHPIRVEVWPPGATRGVLSVAADGISLDPSIEPVGRGVRLVLDFLCEAGHAFSYAFQFHKGTTFIERRIGRTYSNPCATPATIWRN
jgi:hypothetical protein